MLAKPDIRAGWRTVRRRIAAPTSNEYRSLKYIDGLEVDHRQGLGVVYNNYLKKQTGRAITNSFLAIMFSIANLAEL